MSGWDLGDRQVAEDQNGTGFVGMNNITVPGLMPHDQVPSPCKRPPLANIGASPLAQHRGGPFQVPAFVPQVLPLPALHHQLLRLPQVHHARAGQASRRQLLAPAQQGEGHLPRGPVRAGRLRAPVRDSEWRRVGHDRVGLDFAGEPRHCPAKRGLQHPRRTQVRKKVQLPQELLPRPQEAQLLSPSPLFNSIP